MPPERQAATAIAPTTGFGQPSQAKGSFAKQGDQGQQHQTQLNFPLIKHNGGDSALSSEGVSDPAVALAGSRFERNSVLHVHDTTGICQQFLALKPRADLANSGAS